jgi:serine protease
MYQVFGGPNAEYVYTSGLIDAVYRCRDAGAKIISMSLGGGEHSAVEEDAFAVLFNSHNILSVASSGNSGYEEDNYPASYPSVLSVGAIDRNKNYADFSTYGKAVDLAAPGVEVLSTLPMDGECQICIEYGLSKYGPVDGTSMAAPHVSGVAALLYSYFPNSNATDVHDALINSAEDLGDAGRDDRYGHGLVNAYFALEELNGGRIPGGPLVLPNGVACNSDEIYFDMLLETGMNEECLVFC